MVLSKNWLWSLGGPQNAREEACDRRDRQQIEVLAAQSWPVAEVIRLIRVPEVTLYRWRTEYGRLNGDQLRHLKELEAENARLRRAVSDLTHDRMMPAEARYPKGSARKL